MRLNGFHFFLEIIFYRHTIRVFPIHLHKFTAIVIPEKLHHVKKIITTIFDVASANFTRKINKKIK